jgi:hypothetical protein
VVHLGIDVGVGSNSACIHILRFYNYSGLELLSTTLNRTLLIVPLLLPKTRQASQITTLEV